MSHRAGFVNILGKPNVGKSTLMNALMGERLSIITAKAQTTRHRILGIFNDENHQIIFSDTPGIIDPQYKLQEKMMAQLQESLGDADVFLLVIDAADAKPIDKQGELYAQLIDKLKKTNTPLVIAINKVDLLTQDKVVVLGTSLREMFPSAEIIGISALHQFQTKELFDILFKHIPEHPPYFDKEDISDRNLRFFTSEIIREKILENYSQEIPYSVHVVINSFKEEPTITRIQADILVERDSQKGIIIGKNGAALKKTGTDARLALEIFLQTKVFLEVFVKVKKDWRGDEKTLSSMGY